MDISISKYESPLYIIVAPPLGLITPMMITWLFNCVLYPMKYRLPVLGSKAYFNGFPGNTSGKVQLV